MVSSTRPAYELTSEEMAAARKIELMLVPTAEALNELVRLEDAVAAKQEQLNLLEVQVSTLEQQQENLRAMNQQLAFETQRLIADRAQAQAELNSVNEQLASAKRQQAMMEQVVAETKAELRDVIREAAKQP